MRVARSDSDRRIEWLGYLQDAGSKADYDKLIRPDSDRLFLGTDTDQCSSNSLRVVGTAREVTVAKGRSAELAVGTRIRWYCDGSEEFSTLPPGTNWIVVSRAAEGREITWKSYLKP